ncbi:uncharacterized protein LOC117100504 [Anneissia japonica]|uniref:uncharacterized protein LOC117100504 n=1 Tax=Anneissia japonica TaxID=1529436 RepID=UPI00142599F7|nr:uncharacterized protein LOC117100504 [Anneissia japonica]
MDGVLSLFKGNASTSICIVIKCRRGTGNEEDCVDGANSDERGTIAYDMECMITPTIRTCEMAVSGFSCPDKLLSGKTDRQPMFIFGNFYNEEDQCEDQLFFECENTSVVARKAVAKEAEARKKPTLVVHHYVHFEKFVPKKILIIECNDKFITASADNEVKLKDGEINKLLDCDGRAFIYHKNIGPDDNIMLESLQYRNRYLGFDSPKVKMIPLENWESATAKKCRLKFSDE